MARRSEAIFASPAPISKKALARRDGLDQTTNQTQRRPNNDQQTIVNK
jgi:hypothetical protein